MNEIGQSEKKATATLNAVNQLDSALMLLLRTSKTMNKANLLPQKENAVPYQKINPMKFKSLQFNAESLLEEMLDYQSKVLAKFNRHATHTQEARTIVSNMLYCSQLFEKNKTDEFKGRFHKKYELVEKELKNSRDEILHTYTPIIDFWYEKCRLNKLRVDKGPTESLKDVEGSIGQLKMAYCTKPHAYKILGKRESMDNEEAFDPEVYEDSKLIEEGLRDIAEFTRRFKKNTVDGLVFENTENYIASRKKSSKKEVDRRATKGRKLKYEVHEKIINFMVPMENELLLPNRDVVMNQVFGNKNKENVIEKEKVKEDLDISLF